MAEYKFGDGLKKLVLAGIGAVAVTAEKGQEVIGELVKKGELTVEQGKDLNKDLQRSFKESMDKRGINIDEITQKISKMSTEELTKIKEQLAAAEKMVSEKLEKASGELEETVEEIKAAAEDAAEEAGETAEEAVEKAEETAEEAVEKAEEAAEAAEKAEEAAEEEKTEE